MTSAHRLDLSGWTALVSGGAGGIGRAVVAQLLAQGARVAVVDLIAPTTSAGSTGEFLECDLADGAAIASLGTELEARDIHPDLFVHCAGITRDAVLWKMPVEDWEQVMRVNLDSAFHLLRIVVPTMRARGRGSVVLVSSINGERGKFGQANYAASKAGLLGLCRTAARELGRFGIRVNAVAPGLIDTAMTRTLPPEAIRQATAETALGRCGTPADVAHAVLFLCSGLSSHITGQVLRVDGGQLIA